MPTVENTVLVDAPLALVYEIAKDNRSFPEFMKDVQSLTVVEESGNRVVSDYVATVSAFNLKVRWTQEDVWDDQKYVCTFRQLKGDYDELEGHWHFTEEGGRVKFASFVRYDYRVPGLGPLVGRVVHSLVAKNLQGILDAIRDRAEARHQGS
jgi:ribosome-associated toxin RatA of RatAB toxin-antitoxin module